MTSEELAYAAGMIDGDGSISIRRMRTHHQIVVQLSSVDERICVWLKERFGGSIGRYGDSRPNRRPVFKWYIASKAAEKVLRAIRPYLVLKGEQADLALELRDTKGLIVDESVYDTREHLKERVMALNSGVAYGS